MSNRTFDILFDGKLVEGFTQETAKANLQTLFKLDAAQVDKMFTGSTVSIKKGLDRQTASKYQAALNKAGIKIQLILSQTGSPSTKQTDSTEQSKQNNPQSETIDNVAVLPAGSDLLKPNEKSDTRPVDVSIDHIELKPNPASFGIDAGATPHSADQVNYPESTHIASDFNFDLANTGEILGIPSDTPDLNLDLSHITLSETGSLLGDENSSQDDAPVNVDTEQFSIAEAGEDILKKDEKKIIESVVVDTSRLNIETPE